MYIKKLTYLLVIWGLCDVWLKCMVEFRVIVFIMTSSYIVTTKLNVGGKPRKLHRSDRWTSQPLISWIKKVSSYISIIMEQNSSTIYIWIGYLQVAMDSWCFIQCRHFRKLLNVIGQNEQLKPHLKPGVNSGAPEGRRFLLH
jgi:hypothetical protein